ncbi:MAG: PIG-L family deacetylase [Acidobacteriota bacterium]|nr:PIG-L family deacetylase [Acidobacteriota bacterium]
MKFAIAVAIPAALAFAVWAADANGELSPTQAARVNPNSMLIDLNRGASGLSRYLMALRTRASILMVTAHPDDEDGGMLTYETRHEGARATLFTLNRGEGGQNAMSTDLYDAMGLMRTEELLQSDRYYGVDQYWGTVIDYGFSKTREEALAKWGFERVLSDAVRVVRMTRPLVVTSVFVGAPTDGHGNHQVAGEMAQEVYLAAGDPNRFPEQIRQGLRPWKPLKVYARVPFFAPTKENTIYDYATDKYGPIRFYDYVAKTWINKTPSTDVAVPEGTLDQSSGLTFLQIGREGWGYQKSQNGGGTVPPPSLYSAPYHRYGSRVPVAAVEKSFYDGIDVSVEGIASLATEGDAGFLKEGLARLQNCVNTASEKFSPGKSATIAPTLADGLRLTRELLEQVHGSSLAEPGRSDVVFELDRKVEQFEKALTIALGLSFQAVVAPEKEPSGPFAAFGGPPVTFTTAIPGQVFAIQTQFLNGGTEPVNVDSIVINSPDGKPWKISEQSQSARGSVDGAHEIKGKFSVTAPENATLTRPYFERPDQEQPYYNLNDERFRNLSSSPYPLLASARIEYRGVAWTLRQTVQSNTRIEGIGLKQEPLLMGPALSISVSPAAGAVPLSSISFNFTCNLRSNVKGPASGTLRLHMPEGWQSVPSNYPFSFGRDGESENFSFRISPQAIQAKHYEIRAVAEYQGKTFAEGYRLVGYPGLRPYPYYRPAAYQATGVDVKTAPNLRVAFLPGTGDDVPRALEDLGLRATILSSNDLENGNLSVFDAIILGVRAYAVRPELRANNKSLLKYVHDGGVLIVQYNLQNFDGDYGPYPFSLGSNAQKVVDENSPVKFLVPASPALNWPNKITETDFSGWEEERGHGFMEKWDGRYQALLETRDPDQDPQRGGLLLAHYGKGFYVYDAFALYRQLPSGVPGAYRILANLVSLHGNPEYK